MGCAHAKDLSLGSRGSRARFEDAQSRPTARRQEPENGRTDGLGPSATREGSPSLRRSGLPPVDTLVECGLSRRGGIGSLVAGGPPRMAQLRGGDGE